ncbi:nuclear transport factor 2 family protein [Streptomyces kunmingensis]|uniref:Nuclear transport factor 2 family protein n=1 Tax=Streptomyces kunmingensis TaxID=68225 RepID=A0ABU6C9R6_9ACTN|nr:nuclear transport factor 2 family protein [Streptomyces kunmingensis]MEB3961449.1 nuclear transport factor 2 family protein [Streptomyces kunmingensis]
MSDTDNTTSPAAIADKFAVVETLYRYAAGLDLRDKDLLASAFADDAVADFGPATRKAGQEYPPINGREVIASALLGSLDHLDTTHSVSNPRVSLDGDTAQLEGIVACQHLPRKDHSRHVLMTNRYNVDLVRSGEVWVIQRLTVDNAWTEGDPTVLAGI